MTEQQILLSGLAFFCVLLLMVLLRKPLLYLFSLVARTALGCGLLALLAPVGQSLGIHLGVNLFNSLVIGLFGLSGLGLLVLLDWLVKL